MLRLHEHITTHLPDREPLRFEPDKQITLAPRLPAGALPAQAVDSTGYQHVMILCLYATQSARSRMLGELQALTGTPLRFLADNQAADASDRLAVITRHCPEMLAHGPLNRAAMVSAIVNSPDLAHRHDCLISAWVETEYHPAVPIDRQADAKRHLRRLLGHFGIPCQFLATAMPRPTITETGTAAVRGEARSMSTAFALSGA